jgi:hypothetical protein
MKVICIRVQQFEHIHIYSWDIQQTTNMKNAKKHENNWHKENAQNNQEVSLLVYNSSLWQWMEVQEWLLNAKGTLSNLCHRLQRRHL